MLVDSDQWLMSCDEDVLADGVNLAMLGSELLQFGTADPLGGGAFRLGNLLRGRLGTEHHAASHVAGEPFILIERDALVAVPVPAFAIGATISAEPRTPGDPVEAIVSTASIRPPSPTALGAEADAAGGLSVRWTRRSRKGWAWLDEVDAPLGEASESYRVTLTSAAGSIERTIGEPALNLAAAELAPLGSTPWTVSVRQLGDHAASMAASIQFPTA